MTPRQSLSRRLGTAARWPLGIAWTSWRYLWRTTPLHRRELSGPLPGDESPSLPPEIAREGLQTAAAGVGPMFRRRYTARVRHPHSPAREIMKRLQGDPDIASPREFATFVKTLGAEGTMRVGDEFLVRMAGPWDGPVRVVEVDESSFRLVTLEGHLEAGQVRFTARDLDDEALEFRIESWARSGDRVANVLYHHLRMAKEVQFHMWTSYLERVVKRSGGRLTGGIDVETHRIEAPGDAAER